MAKDIEQQLLDSNAVMITHGVLTRDSFKTIGELMAAREAKMKARKAKSKRKRALKKK